MRVLWFTNTPSNYRQGTNAYNGGGWISSLEAELVKNEKIELGVSFLFDGPIYKDKQGKVCYYPICNPYVKSVWGRIRKYFVPAKLKDRYFIKKYLQIIDDFHPDLINIFGTEQNFGLIAQFTEVPIVIHIQGLLIPYFTAFFPPGYNLADYICSDSNLIHIYKRCREYLSFKKNAGREKDIISYNYHFMGRTEWDKHLISIFNPHATYDYCSEILRDAFYNYHERKLPDELVIITTISRPLYKGFDVVLKCARILKEQMMMDFTWQVYGNIDPSLVERKEKVKSKNVNVCLMGVVSPEELVQSISCSTLYVHPSYIDNSPNSVCEAQMLGCTVIGQNVGGMSSLIFHGKTGILVPANDPYQMACAIRELYQNPTLNISLGKQAEEFARQRHDKGIIIKDLESIYLKYQQK